MTALERTVSGRDHDDVAVAVGQALGFNMPRLVEIALDEALTTAEGGDCLARRGLEELGDFVHLAGDLQASAAAAECSFDRDRQSVLGREGDDRIGVIDWVRRAGHQGSADLLGNVGPDLVAQRLDGSGGGPIQISPGSEHSFGKGRILSKKAVSRVDGVGAAAGGDVENLGDIEVGLRRLAPPSAYASSASETNSESKSGSA